MPSRKTTADLKTRALIQSIWDFDIHVVRNEPESLLLEGKLIKEYRPKYNVSFRDDKRFLLLKVHPGERFPRFQLVRVKKEDGAKYFGPVPALRRTAHDPRVHQPELSACAPAARRSRVRIDYRHCNDDVIRNCSAPCIGEVDEERATKRAHRAEPAPSSMAIPKNTSPRSRSSDDQGRASARISRRRRATATCSTT